MSKRVQPVWAATSSSNRPKLRLFNSLTRQKEDFVPLDGNNVTWYSCGPTVYDASHMGHARSYISFDILRRVLANYFGYNIQYVMNITDIDDKIIKRARQYYLYEEYVARSTELPLDQFLSEQNTVMKCWEAKCALVTDADKKSMILKLSARITDAVEQLTAAVANKDEAKVATAKQNYLLEAKDAIAEWLDSSNVNRSYENEIFQHLSRHWETAFHTDMQALNILPPDVLTRVSEYVPQIIAFIERIIANGLGYVSNGSVYFDVDNFDKREKHHYAKLVPEAYGDTTSLQEGEGDLSVGEERLSEKRSPNDFALWKASKTGEPSWPSPWGNGRPGWHIECSAMASDVFGSIFDIHTGGVDLKFPHHDNELAQSEAAFDQSEWVKYFLHTGHLTIAGCKMSKSLKNFVTIDEALQKHTACQLRLMFLLHAWNATLDYSENTMEKAIKFERFLNEFFLNVKDMTRVVDSKAKILKFDAWTDAERTLQDKFNRAQNKVYESLCNNVDTRAALDAVRDLVFDTNHYMRDNKITNAQILRKIASYITQLLTTFGAINNSNASDIGFPVSIIGEGTDGPSGGLESTVMPYINATAEFRRAVRNEAKTVKAMEILKLCDDLRDNVLVQLNVRLEDKDDDKFAVKMVDREIILKEREAKRDFEAKRLKEKEQRKQAAAEAGLAKEAQKRIDPKIMFLHESNKYSTFDNEGVPVLDAAGNEISKGQLKKLKKLQQQQSILYTEYLASTKQ